MEPDEIKDSKTLEAWLNARPETTRQADAVAIAQRAALRVFPIWAAAMDGDWARGNSLTALPILRLNLTFGVVRKYPIAAAAAFAAARAARTVARDDDATLTAAAAARAADATLTAFATARAAAAFADAARAARAADAAADAALTAASLAAAALTAAVFAAEAAFWKTISDDASRLVTGIDLSAVPLWTEEQPDWFNKDATAMQAIWQKAPPHWWSFWRRWWQGVLTGNQIDWDLQREVALIDDAIWREGPEAIAREIERIEQRLGLLSEVRRLRAALAATRVAEANAAHRQHNNPPEPIEPVAEVRAQVAAISSALAEAEVELSKPAPSPSALRKIGKALFTWTGDVLSYCAGLADVAAKKGAETLGQETAKWLARAGFVGFIGQLESIKALAKAILEYATKWGGG